MISKGAASGNGKRYVSERPHPGLVAIQETMLAPPSHRASSNRSFDELQHSSDPIVSYKLHHEVAFLWKKHHHRRAQLIRPLTTPATIRLAGGHYILQPGEAAWLPGGIEHSVSSSQAQIYHSIYVRSDLAANLSPVSGVLQVSPLLGELIQQLIDLGCGRGDRDAYPHLVALTLGELRHVRDERPQLSMPSDMRLLRICHALNDNPGDRRTLADWAVIAGASRRMLERGFQDETGMSFSRWRQTCRIRAAIPLLQAGQPVQQVAGFTGYDSPSAFAAMFRRVTGAAPAALQSDRISSREPDRHAEPQDTEGSGQRKAAAPRRPDNQRRR
ncbi:MAG: AraC family transcriptional regulator [Mesorhizobium sp.]|nr:MAG: AraC family transcriptional regulator [Mesorhizobium sp.]